MLVVELGRRAGLRDAELRDAYYVTVLRFLGCTGFAHEEAHVYGAGDDLGTRNVMSMADAANPVGTLRAITAGIGRGASAVARVRAVARLVLDPEAVTKHSRAQCDTTLRLATILGMSETVRASVAHVCERFDGKGAPSRVLLAAISGAWVWERFLAAEPAPAIVGSTGAADDVAFAFAQFADLKSIYTLGHSSGVADLAVRAAEGAGLPADTVRDLRHAALLHDIGRVSVPNGIWDKPDRLGVTEWERVRLHAYYTERIVLRAPAWSRAARIAAAAHERLDASGYHRAAPATLLARPERILAAADVLHALLEPRPHRPARSLDDACNVLQAESRAGRLDADAVAAVLEAAGARARRDRRAWPRGLSDREVEVLRLVARGKSNREIGALLAISPRTVQNHVAHVYDKVGVYSRAGAALFVTEQGLLD